MSQRARAGEADPKSFEADSLEGESFSGVGRRESHSPRMFQLIQTYQSLFLTNNMSEAAMQEHQTAKNGDMSEC